MYSRFSDKSIGLDDAININSMNSSDLLDGIRAIYARSLSDAARVELYANRDVGFNARATIRNRIINSTLAQINNNSAVTSVSQPAPISIINNNNLPIQQTTQQATQPDIAVDSIFEEVKPGDPKLIGFNSTKWAKLSAKEYRSDKTNPKLERPLYQVLIRLMLENFKLSKEIQLVNIFLIGDFIEIEDAIRIMGGRDFQIKDIDIDWNGFVPDPYLAGDSNSRAVDLNRIGGNVGGLSRMANDVKVSPIHQLYDKYVGQKWLSGEDNSGALTKENIIGLATIPQKIQNACIATLNKNDYLNDLTNPNDNGDIRLYYHMCLAVIASCAPGGTAIIKIPLPTNRALYGIYSLFAMFFPKVRLIKLRYTPLDNDICYLLGMGFISAPEKYAAVENANLFIVRLLLEGDPMDSVLYYLSSSSTNYPIVDRQLNEALAGSTRTWIDKLQRAWYSRNINQSPF